MDKRIFYVLIFWLTGVHAVTPEQSASTPNIPQILLDKVAEGDAESAYFIATAFAKGEGAFDVDLEQAKTWFLKAAEMNHAHAMFELGLLLFFDKEFAKAHRWFGKAAAQGHGESFYRLGIYHIYGLNESALSCEKAYAFFEQAQKRKVNVAFNDHAWMMATLPDKKCRNGEKAWRIYSELEQLYGANGLIPLSFLDTKAAVLAEISEFNEAIKLQTYVVESYCDVSLKDSEDMASWMKLAADQPPEFCSHGVERLQRYLDRKPWREPPSDNFGEKEDES